MLQKIFTGLSLTICCAISTTLFANVQQGQQQQGLQYSDNQQSGIQWYTDFNQATQAAQQQNKPIVLFFSGSDWCGWCKKLDQEVFKTQEFANAAGDKFIFVDVDFPMNKQLPPQQSQQNAMLKQKYNITGYPTVVVLDPNLNVLEVGGYRPGGGKDYASYLMQFSKNK